MKQVIKAEPALSEEERNLLAVAYKNKVFWHFFFLGGLAGHNIIYIYIFYLSI